MTCVECENRGKTWKGLDPKCAFEDEEFSKNNWNCATMNKLRDVIDNPSWSDDQSTALIPMNDGRFILLSWYKNRGCTEGAWIIDESECRRLTIKDAEELI